MPSYYANKGLTGRRIVATAVGSTLYTSAGASGGTGTAIAANTIYQIVGKEVRVADTVDRRVVPVVVVNFATDARGSTLGQVPVYVNINDGKFVMAA